MFRNPPSVIFTWWIFIWILFFFLSGPASVFSEEDYSHFKRGLKAFKKEDFNSAQKAFNQAVQKNPSDALSFYYLGLTYSRLGKSRAAIASFQEAKLLDPEMPGLHLSLGIVYYKSKLYQAARSELSLAIQRNPNEASPYFFLGLTQQQLGEYRQSVASFAKASSLDPALSQSSWYYIGLAHFHDGKSDQAREALERSIDKDSGTQVAQNARDLLKKDQRGIPIQKNYSVYGGMGFLYDDNLTVSAQDLVSEEGDFAVVFELGGMYQFFNKGPYSAEVAYDFYQSLYFDIGEFNLQSHNISLSATREVDQWDLGLDYILGYSLLGGSSFLTTNMFIFGAGRSWDPKWYTRVSYMPIFKNFNQDFNDPRDGVNHSIGFDQFYFFSGKESYGQLGYRLMDEDTSGDQFDYIGHEVTLSGRIPTYYAGKLLLRYHLLWKDFQNITPSIGEERLDKRHTFQFTWTRIFEDMIEFKFDFQHIESDSNLPAVDYSENIVMMGVTVKY